MADVGIYPYEGRERDLNDIKNGNHWMVFFVNDVDITIPEDVEFADLVTATWPGYSNQPMTFGPITRNADDNAQMTSATVTIGHTGGGSPQTCYGWAWCQYDGTALRIRRLLKFETPVVMDGIGDTVSATVVVDQGECPP